MANIVVGIIGGTGFDQDPNLLKSKQLVDLQETPFGRASDKQAISGEIEGVPVFIIGRHGKDHDVSPSHVNYRANLWTLVHQLGCTHILATSACGSLKEEIAPGHVGILDQYIDRTCTFRDRSFYKVCHVEQRSPINQTIQGFFEEACLELDLPHHKNLTVVTIEGPRFSTLAESRLFRSWGCDIVNMTSVPEVPLTSELPVFYGVLMLVTDYDCWKEGEESVTADLVVQRMKDLGAKARLVLPRVIKKISQFDWSEQREANKRRLAGSIMCS